MYTKLSVPTKIFSRVRATAAMLHSGVSLWVLWRVAWVHVQPLPGGVTVHMPRTCNIW